MTIAEILKAIELLTDILKNQYPIPPETLGLIHRKLKILIELINENE